MDTENKLKIAVSQFPVSSDLLKNKDYIFRHIIKAAKLKVDVIHFPELALSGYETNIEEINWQLLDSIVDELKSIASKLKMHIVIGLHHRNPQGGKPYNATYLITDEGKLAGKYIKANLYGAEKERFSTKENEFVYTIKNVSCGFLTCYDSCFLEAFKEYRNKGVKLLFLSYYNAKSSKKKNSMDELMRAQFITRSTDNLMHISGSNSSSYYSRMPSSFVAPDGTIISAKRHTPGILVVNYPNAQLGWTYDNAVG
jgi:predicted amidohydrolase